MPKEVRNLYFEAQGNFRNRFHLKFPDEPGRNWVGIWSQESGIGHHSTGIVDILSKVPQDSDAYKWLQAGKMFKVECGAGGAVDYWGFNSPLYSEELQYGGSECISAVLSGSVASPSAGFQASSSSSSSSSSSNHCLSPLPYSKWLPSSSSSSSSDSKADKFDDERSTEDNERLLRELRAELRAVRYESWIYELDQVRQTLRRPGWKPKLAGFPLMDQILPAVKQTMDELVAVHNSVAPAVMNVLDVRASDDAALDRTAYTLLQH
nr:hypothetical protein CFP56_64723 [Quercus suber]